MKTRKNIKKYLWFGWQSEAAEHFKVSRYIIKKWYSESHPELIVWLAEQIDKRKKERAAAMSILLDVL